MNSFKLIWYVFLTLIVLALAGNFLIASYMNGYVVMYLMGILVGDIGREIVAMYRE